jgi:hypothetical protein
VTAGDGTDIAADRIAALLVGVLGPAEAARFAARSPALGPVTATPAGTCVWAVPDDTRRVLTWDGPGGRVWLCRPPRRRAAGPARIGARIRAASGPCATRGGAQDAVDTWTTTALLPACAGAR